MASEQIAPAASAEDASWQEVHVEVAADAPDAVTEAAADASAAPPNLQMHDTPASLQLQLEVTRRWGWQQPPL